MPSSLEIPLRVEQRRLRIVLADDHLALHHSLRGLLEPDYQVVGFAADGVAMIRLTLELHPDILISDVSLPGINGFEAVREILRSRPNTRVIFLTVHGDLEMARNALTLGARGYVVKTHAGDELLPAVADVANGKTYVSPGLG
jgi:DNA-binding NarL/FixJ family response regulator